MRAGLSHLRRRDLLRLLTIISGTPWKLKCARVSERHSYSQYNAARNCGDLSYPCIPPSDRSTAQPSLACCGYFLPSFQTIIRRQNSGLPKNGGFKSSLGCPAA